MLLLWSIPVQQNMLMIQNRKYFFNRVSYLLNGVVLSNQGVANGFAMLSQSELFSNSQSINQRFWAYIT